MCAPLCASLLSLSSLPTSFLSPFARTQECCDRWLKNLSRSIRLFFFPFNFFVFLVVGFFSPDVWRRAGGFLWAWNSRHWYRSAVFCGGLHVCLPVVLVSFVSSVMVVLHRLFFSSAETISGSSFGVLLWRGPVSGFVVYRSLRALRSVSYWEILLWCETLLACGVGGFFFFSRFSGFDRIQRTFAIARVPRWTRSTVLWYSISSFWRNGLSIDGLCTFVQLLQKLCEERKDLSITAVASENHETAKVLRSTEDL
jgi:hypothetical protein